MTTPPKRKLVVVVCATVLFLATATLSWNELRRAQIAAKRASCRGRLAIVRFAIQNYVDTHGHMPPIVVESGDLQHSWRSQLYKSLVVDETVAYNTAESWDSPHNRACAASVEGMFSEPGTDAATTGYSQIVAVDTKGGAWYADDLKRNDRSIILAFVPESRVGIFEPGDFSLPMLRTLAASRCSKRFPILICSLEGEIMELSENGVIVPVNK